MKVTAVKKYKGMTYEVELDGERKIYLHADILVDYDVRTGMELDRTELRKIIYASNFRRAYQYALYRLDFRDYSAKEMKKKLVDTYKNEALCEAVIKKLESNNFINDERLSARLAEKYVMTKKFGLRRAKRELILKGIGELMAEDALATYEERVGENLAELIEKKYSRRLTDRDDRNAVEKVKNSLVRLGYGFDEINRAVREYFDSLEQD